MDLIADVLQHANANKVKVATSKLAGSASKLAVKLPPADFQKISAAHNFKNVQAAANYEFKKDQSRIPGDSVETLQSPPKSRDTRKKEAMHGLETVLATKMVEAMMPEDQSELYGDGTAGEIWRGFHIDTMGKALASQRLLSGISNDASERSRETPGAGQKKMIVPFTG